MKNHNLLYLNYFLFSSALTFQNFDDDKVFEKSFKHTIFYYYYYESTLRITFNNSILFLIKIHNHSLLYGHSSIYIYSYFQKFINSYFPVFNLFILFFLESCIIIIIFFVSEEKVKSLFLLREICFFSSAHKSLETKSLKWKLFFLFLYNFFYFSFAAKKVLLEWMSHKGVLKLLFLLST